MNFRPVLQRLFSLSEEESETCIEMKGNEMTGGTGFLSYRRQVKVKKANSTTHLFLKSSDRTRQDLGEMEKFSDQFCTRECLFYGCMAPLLQRTADQFGLGCIGLPLVYHESVTPSGTLLVMEDLGEAGFQLAPPLMSVAEVRCVLDSLARVQAAFWLTRTRLGGAADGILGPNSAKLYGAGSLTGMGMNTEETMASGLELFRRNFSNYLKCESHIELINAYLSNELIDTAIQLQRECREEATAVGVVHRDLYYSNCMIRRDSKSQPVESRIIDWQMFGVGSMVADLGPLWLTSVDTAIAAEEFLPCVEYFYETTRSIYESNAQQSFPVSLDRTKELAVRSLSLGITEFITTADAMPAFKVAKPSASLENLMLNIVTLIERFRL